MSLLFHMKNYLLILGDILAIALITFIGFASHGEAGVLLSAAHGGCVFPADDLLVYPGPCAGTFSKANRPQDKKSMASSTCDDVCRLIRCRLTRTHFERTDHPNFCACPGRDVRFWDTGLAGNLPVPET